jgi:hypothetical protein
MTPAPNDGFRVLATVPKFKFEIPAILLKPRDPNHQTLTDKRNASGAHRDRKKTRSRRPNKHKKLDTE